MVDVSVLYQIYTSIDLASTLFLSRNTAQWGIFAGGTVIATTFKITMTVDGAVGPVAVKTWNPTYDTGPAIPGAAHTSDQFNLGLQLPTPDQYPDVTFDMVVSARGPVVKTDPSAANGQTLILAYQDDPPGAANYWVNLTARYTAP